jgi:hypothetical protein
MRKSLCFALVLAFLSPNVAAILARDKPNFAGTWVLLGGLQGTVSVLPNPAERLTIAQDGSAITVRSAEPARQLTCRLDGTPSQDTYSAPSPAPTAQTWTRVSQCRWLTDALVLTEAHSNAASGQAWEIMRTYSLDLQSRHLVVTVVGAAKVMTYMETQTRFYRKSNE